VLVVDKEEKGERSRGVPIFTVELPIDWIADESFDAVVPLLRGSEIP